IAQAMHAMSEFTGDVGRQVEIPIEMGLPMWKAISPTPKLGWAPYLHNPKLRGRLRRITAPTLVVAGAQDGLVPPVYAETFAAEIPNAHLEVVDGAAHWLPLEKPGELPARDGSAVARSDGTVHTLFPVAASPSEGEELRDWVVRERAARTIEVGLGYGISALFTCEGLLANGDADARHVVIDPHQDARFANCGLQFLDDASVADMVEFHPGESQVVLPRF